MDVLILAAGYATRLYPYTLNTPKPLLPIKDRPLIDYIIDRVDALPEVGRIIVVTNGKFYEQFEAWRTEKQDARLVIVNDKTETVETRLGAIGDIGYAITDQNISSDLIVIAGDNLFTYDLKDYYNYFQSVDGDCVCVKKENDPELLKRLGVCVVDDKNKVTSFVEKPAEPPSNNGVYATYMFRQSSLPLVLDYLSQKHTSDAPGFFIEWLHQQTDVYAYFMDGECYDIGTVESYEHIQKTIDNIL